MSEREQWIEDQREALAEQAEAWNLPHLADACIEAMSREEASAHASVDLACMGLTAEQSIAAVRAGYLLALLMLVLNRAGELSWAPEGGEA